MTNAALFLLPVLFLGGICGILHSLSRRAAPPLPPLPPLPSRERPRGGESVVVAQHRREPSNSRRARPSAESS
jgi:hypothetical protein